MSRDAATGGGAGQEAPVDTVHLAQGAAASRDVAAARPSGQIRTAEDAARLASRISDGLRRDPSAALLAFGATRGAAVQSLLAKA
jgi:hypothetical protein